MSVDSRDLLDKLKQSIAALKQFCYTLSLENRTLKRSLMEREETIVQLRIELEEANTKYKNLKVAQGVTLDEGSIKEAKGRFGRLVREIDKCISLLNE